MSAARDAPVAVLARALSIVSTYGELGTRPCSGVMTRSFPLQAVRVAVAGLMRRAAATAACSMGRSKWTTTALAGVTEARPATALLPATRTGGDWGTSVVSAS